MTLLQIDDESKLVLKNATKNNSKNCIQNRNVSRYSLSLSLSYRLETLFFTLFFSKRRNIKFVLFLYFPCESKVSQAAVPIRGHNWFVSQPAPQCQSRSKSIRKRKGKDGYHTRKLVNSDWVVVVEGKKKRRRNNNKKRRRNGRTISAQPIDRIGSTTADC